LIEVGLVLDAVQRVGERRVLLARVGGAVGGDEVDAGVARELHELQVAPRLFDREVLLQLEVEVAREQRVQPARLGERAVAILGERTFDPAEGAARQRDQPAGAASEVVDVQPRVALAAPHLRSRDQVAQVRVATSIFYEQHDARTVLEGQFAADDRREAARARVCGEADRAVESVAVGQRQRAEVEFDRPFDQFFGMRAALQKCEVRPAVQFCVARCINRRTHADTSVRPRDRCGGSRRRRGRRRTRHA
jgi:hypothetical protein